MSVIVYYDQGRNDMFCPFFAVLKVYFGEMSCFLILEIFFLNTTIAFIK